MPEQLTPKRGQALHRTWFTPHWQRIGIMASIIWILSAGAHTLYVQRNRELERIGWFCHLTTSGSGPDYKKCLDDEKAYYPKLVPGEGEQAAIFAFVPVVLSWGFVCLLLALV